MARYPAEDCHTAKCMAVCRYPEEISDPWMLDHQTTQTGSSYPHNDVRSFPEMDLISTSLISTKRAWWSLSRRRCTCVTGPIEAPCMQQVPRSLSRGSQLAAPVMRWCLDMWCWHSSKRYYNCQWPKKLFKVTSHLEKKSSNEQGNAHYSPRPAKVAG